MFYKNLKIKHICFIFSYIYIVINYYFHFLVLDFLSPGTFIPFVLKLGTLPVTRGSADISPALASTTSWMRGNDAEPPCSLAFLVRLVGAFAGSAADAGADPIRMRADVLHALRPQVERWLASGIPLRVIVKPWLSLFHAQAGGRLFRQVLSNPNWLNRNDWSVVEEALGRVGVSC